MRLLITKIDVDSVRIYRCGTNCDEEIVGWTESEWLEDPAILPSIFNAIALTYTEPRTLIRLLAEGKRNAIQSY